MRLIDADDLMACVIRKHSEVGKIRYTEGFNDAILRVRSMIHSAKTIDAEPVRHGRWILSDIQNKEDNDNGNYAYICSNCFHRDIQAKTAVVPYCWYCGAKMEKGDEK